MPPRSVTCYQPRELCRRAGDVPPKRRPQNAFIVMRGPTDNNATLFAEGYMSMLKPGFDAGKYVNAAEPAGTWDPATARMQ